jgi:hypothetical protein
MGNIHMGPHQKYSGFTCFLLTGAPGWGGALHPFGTPGFFRLRLHAGNFGLSFPSLRADEKHDEAGSLSPSLRQEKYIRKI